MTAWSTRLLTTGTALHGALFEKDYGGHRERIPVPVIARPARPRRGRAQVLIGGRTFSNVRPFLFAKTCTHVKM